MPLLTYNPEDFDLSNFVYNCIAECKGQGYSVSNLGFLTYKPGCLLEVTDVDIVNDAHIKALRSVFYSLGADQVSIEIDTMSQTIRCKIEKNVAKKKSSCIQIYTYIPPLPIVLLIVLCLYKFQKQILETSLHQES